MKSADYVACHAQDYLNRYGRILLDNIKENGIFLVNCRFPSNKAQEVIGYFYIFNASRQQRSCSQAPLNVLLLLATLKV